MFCSIVARRLIARFLFVVGSWGWSRLWRSSSSSIPRFWWRITLRRTWTTGILPATGPEIGRSAEQCRPGRNPGSGAAPWRLLGLLGPVTRMTRMTCTFSLLFLASFSKGWLCLASSSDGILPFAHIFPKLSRFTVRTRSKSWSLTQTPCARICKPGAQWQWRRATLTPSLTHSSGTWFLGWLTQYLERRWQWRRLEGPLRPLCVR
mmetsp:Transcript_50636/g.133421  ORF Transcript_50636/g.133421 Transcript_50636/m.133421 type:complete len:206 (-) Transcript_50636:2562-3179(-)